MVPYLHVGNNISKVRKTQTLDGLDVSSGGVDIPLFFFKKSLNIFAESMLVLLSLFLL